MRLTKRQLRTLIMETIGDDQKNPGDPPKEEPAYEDKMRGMLQGERGAGSESYKKLMSMGGSDLDPETSEMFKMLMGEPEAVDWPAMLSLALDDRWEDLHNELKTMEGILGIRGMITNDDEANYADLIKQRIHTSINSTLRDRTTAIHGGGHPLPATLPDSAREGGASSLPQILTRAILNAYVHKRITRSPKFRNAAYYGL